MLPAALGFFLDLQLALALLFLGLCQGQRPVSIGDPEPAALAKCVINANLLALADDHGFGLGDGFEGLVVNLDGILIQRLRRRLLHYFGLSRNDVADQLRLWPR